MDEGARFMERPGASEIVRQFFQIGMHRLLVCSIRRAVPYEQGLFMVRFPAQFNGAIHDHLADKVTVRHRPSPTDPISLTIGPTRRLDCL